MLWIIDPPMSDRSDRLRRAWAESAYPQKDYSILGTAKAAGWNPNSFKSNMNGNSPFSFEQAKEYARKLGVRAEWLYDGNGPMREPPRVARSPIEVPVIGWASAGQVADIGDVEQGEEGTLVVGNLPPGQYFATPVKGDSMDRVAPEGASIIVNSADRSPRDGHFYLFSLRGETTFKRYRSKPVRRLEPASTNPAHEPIFLADKGWTVVGRVVRSILDLP